MSPDRRRAADGPSLLGGRWHILAHPVFVGCVALLALNDHVLKDRVPGWWTGKISDVAGVAVLAVLIAVLIGTRRAFPLVGIGFLLLKTTPPVAEFARPFLGGTTVRDATDLVALAVLWPLWHLLQGSVGGPTGRGRSPSRSGPPWLVVHLRAGLAGFIPIVSASVALAAVTATSCGPSPAVIGVATLDGTLYAAIDHGFGEVEWARSEDGGWSWEAVDARPRGMPPLAWPTDPAAPYGPLASCDAGGTCWRVGDQRVIERRSPGGPWVEEMRLSEQAFSDISTGCADGQNGVLESVAVSESPSGSSVIVALGAEGVLRRDHDGGWGQRGVLSAPPIPATTVDQAAMRALLPFGLSLALALWLARRRWPSWRAGLAVVVVGWVIVIMGVGFAGVMTRRTTDPALVIGRLALVGMILTTAISIIVARRPQRAPSGLPPRPDVPGRGTGGRNA